MINHNGKEYKKGRIYRYKFLKNKIREFPGSPMVRIQHFHCQGPGSVPSGEMKILQDMQHNPPPPHAGWQKKKKSTL